MLEKTNSSKLKEIAAIMTKSKNLLFITGAGISAESGLPTYRGIGGLYNDEYPEEGISIEDIMSGYMLQARPELTWKYLLQIESSCRKASYNKAHKIIAEWQDHFSTMIFTQNIDNFHHLAGSRNVVEIHGNFTKLYCMNESCSFTKIVESYEHLSIPPYCPKCGAVIRPDVVLFGESLSKSKIKKLESFMSNNLDMIFSIGTTSVFPYISYPVAWAYERQIPSVEINPDITAISNLVQFKINSSAGDALEGLNNLLKANTGKF